LSHQVLIKEILPWAGHFECPGAELDGLIFDVAGMSSTTQSTSPPGKGPQGKPGCYEVQVIDGQGLEGLTAGDEVIEFLNHGPAVHSTANHANQVPKINLSSAAELTWESGGGRDGQQCSQGSGDSLHAIWFHNSILWRISTCLRAWRNLPASGCWIDS
jgi:hypothetical protein